MAIQLSTYNTIAILRHCHVSTHFIKQKLSTLSLSEVVIIPTQNCTYVSDFPELAPWPPYHRYHRTTAANLPRIGAPTAEEQGGVSRPLVPPPPRRRRATASTAQR